MLPAFTQPALSNKICMYVHMYKTNFVVFHPSHSKILKPVIIRFGRKKLNVEVVSNFQVSCWMKI